jgi:Serine dehydrogenase proteinase
MSSWNSILEEIVGLNQPDAFDVVRRKKMKAVQEITGRPLIAYAADFITPNPLKAQFAGNLMSISLADKDGFDEVTRNLPRESKIDVLLHSPGGSAEATESIVELLRDRFSHIRFIIPNVAKSAATMLAMSGEQLLMDERSELGPTDPQMIFTQEGRTIVAPAQAIKDQFETAQKEINADPGKLPSWVPILGWYGPALLAQCDNQLALAEELVSKWLERYMFANNPKAKEKAGRIAGYLADHNNFRSHARRVGMADLQVLEADILDMRTEPVLHDAIRDLYTAISLTLTNTGAYKIVENSNGEALIGMLNINIQQQPPQGPPTATAPTSPVTPPAPTPNRQARRQAARKKR